MNADLYQRSKLAQRALLGAIFSATCLSASAASFDCTKARSKSERLICGDPKLSALDERLAALAAAGKKSAADPRAFQRQLDAAWLVRQKCEDIACVEHWYAQRIAAHSAVPTDAGIPAQSTPPAVPPPAPAPPAPKADAPRKVAAPTPDGPTEPNVSPGAQLQVIGAELGFRIPLTQEEFLKNYSASAGNAGSARSCRA